MKYKIVSDSSSNILSFSKVPYATVPLKIITSEKEYVDNTALDVSRMVAELKVVKGRTQTSCPNVHEWQEAMAGADAVFALTITSGLSGSYSTAEQARKDRSEGVDHVNAADRRHDRAEDPAERALKPREQRQPPQYDHEKPEDRRENKEILRLFE